MFRVCLFTFFSRAGFLTGSLEFDLARLTGHQRPGFFFPPPRIRDPNSGPHGIHVADTLLTAILSGPWVTTVKQGLSFAGLSVPCPGGT